jgi:hypothetical protein
MTGTRYPDKLSRSITSITNQVLQFCSDRRAWSAQLQNNIQIYILHIDGK